MKSIILVLIATITIASANADVPVRTVTRLTGIQSLSIAADGVLQLTSLPHRPPWIPSLKSRVSGEIKLLTDAKLRSGDSIFVADMRHIRLTYTVREVTDTAAILDVHEEESFLGFGEINRRSDYRVHVRPYTRTPDEIEAMVNPKPVTEPIFSTKRP